MNAKEFTREIEKKVINTPWYDILKLIFIDGTIEKSIETLMSIVNEYRFYPKAIDIFNGVINKNPEDVKVVVFSRKMFKYEPYNKHAIELVWPITRPLERYGGNITMFYNIWKPTLDFLSQQFLTELDIKCIYTCERDAINFMDTNYVLTESFDVDSPYIVNGEFHKKDYWMIYKYSGTKWVSALDAVHNIVGLSIHDKKSK